MLYLCETIDILISILFEGRSGRKIIINYELENYNFD